jgi:anti-anti-sigma factor
MAITQEPAIRIEIEEPADRAGERTTTIRLRGRLVLETADEIRGVMKPLIAQGGRIVLNVAGVNYMDSSGLGVLVGLKVSAGNQGNCRLGLQQMTPRIREMLAVTYPTEFFSS